MKILIRAGVAVVVLGALFAGLYAFAFVGDDTEVVAAADRFRPPADWVLESEKVTPDYRACWDGGACPEVEREWAAPVPVTSAYLQSVIADAGLDASVSGQCPQACSAETSVDGFTVRLSVSTPNSGLDGEKVTLRVW
jgi:hypothetical protein